MNILFVNYGDFTTNSLNHIGGFANTLSAAGHACVVVVPDRKETLQHIAHPLFIAATYDDTADELVLGQPEASAPAYQPAPAPEPAADRALPGAPGNPVPALPLDALGIPVPDAATTARLMGELVTGAKPSVDLHPYRVNRF